MPKSDLKQVCVGLEGTVGIVCQDALCEELAQLDTFLVEAVDIPDEALEHDLILEVAEQGAQTVALQQQLMHFQEIARQERVLRFRQAGRLRSSIWRLDNLGVPSWFIKDPSLAAMKEELSYVYDIDDSGEKLLSRMDRELGGVIAPLQDRLHLKGNPQEQLLLACCLLDLPSDLIGTKLGITPNNVRVKKHRLKEQIAKLNDENLDALFGIRR